jgi:phosphinothricin acetyltransferase
MIRDARPADAAAIAAIYNHYIEHTVVTFEVDVLTDDDMRARIAKVQGSGLPWLVWDEGGTVRGYAYASKFRDRAAYRFSPESTVYLAPDAVRQGIGTALYGELVSRVRLAGNHLVLGAVALPNEASVALHESLGFTHVGTFSEVGRKFGRWIDVGFWQLRLDGPEFEGAERATD